MPRKVKSTWDCYMTIDGKRYRAMNYADTKKKAQEFAAKMRKEGWLCRVIKKTVPYQGRTRTAYLIFRRRK